MVDQPMSNNTVLLEIEDSIKQATIAVDLGAAVERLCNNRDFKKVFLEGYFEQEAIRLVHLKSDSNMQTQGSQESILKLMDAIGSVRQYLDTKRQLAGLAMRAIASDEQTREELLAEDIQ